jgi:hypothetical protein
MTPLLAASSAYQAGHYAATAALAVLLVALIVRLSKRTASTRGRRTDALAALVVAALLVGSVIGLSGEKAPGTWETQQGVEMRAGFIAGCNNSSGAEVDCGCAFDHIASEASFDTPEKFATLAGPVAAAQKSQDPADLPPAFLTAMQTCRVATQ